MCVLCGTPDPSHDMLLLRLAVLASGTGFILTPRRWLARQALYRRMARGLQLHFTKNNAPRRAGRSQDAL